MKRTPFSILIAAIAFTLLARTALHGQEQPAADHDLDHAVVRATLLEDDPIDRYGNQFAGSARSRVEKVDPETKSEPDYRLRAEIVIPERKLAGSLTIRPNLDQSLPASHLVEVTLDVPSDFQHGGVSTVRGLMMKQTETVVGTLLRGAAVRQHSNVFIIALSGGDVEKNVELLYGRRWLEIAMVFANGRRALLTIDKDLSGEAAFKQAFASWKKLNPQVAQVVDRIDAHRQVVPPFDANQPPFDTNQR
jgi:hypothetical protein